MLSTALLDIVLNNRLKLAYAEEQEWEEDLIKELHNRVKSCWELWYKPSPHESTSSSKISSVDGDMVIYDDEDLEAHMFAHLKRKRVVEKDELQQYLDAPPVDLPPEAFWRQFLEKPNAVGTSQFPNLARMARDYLSLPATSAPVERLFSAASLIVTEKRGSLRGETVNALLCLQSWYKAGLI
ncbi:hypothetical protein HDU93_008375 [Gonapodya sp. JEL0774]|nr:hypothetical protein HDU93_008375 [Gonapodya sp. JEL0774]